MIKRVYLNSTRTEICVRLMFYCRHKRNGYQLLKTHLQDDRPAAEADLDQTPVPVARPMPEVAEASFAVESWV